MMRINIRQSCRYIAGMARSYHIGDIDLDPVMMFFAASDKAPESNFR
jgi:hypothetical protein